MPCSIRPMERALVILLAVASFGMAVMPRSSQSATQETARESSPPKGIGDPGVLETLEIVPNRDSDGITIRGPMGRQQLVVTGVYSSGQLRDHTRRVAYSVEPTGIVDVDPSGLVTPRGDGTAVIKAQTQEGMTAEVRVHVHDANRDLPINFPNQVVPIFFKLGCSSGSCHGKANGQNGFMLSLMGFYPEDDYEYLVKEGRGRRLFPTSPDESLMLKKPLGIGHRGGKRMEKDSHEYRLLRTWIEQSMPYQREGDPNVVAIECFPQGRTMGTGSHQQITVTAIYSDGSTEDVTHTAVYESNDEEMAEVSATGYVETRQQTGEVAIMALYQGKVATFRATIPLGADIGDMPPPRNLVDEAVFGQLVDLGIPPSPKSDDATFLRRVYVDIAGKLPTEVETSAFLSDTDANKRDKLIDRLLDGTAYADHFANKWSMLLRNKNRNDEDLMGTYAFHRWIWSSLYENKPYDRMAREILTASGDARFNPAVVWYREVNESNEQVEDTAQLFLGLRIQCARCHHHPYEKWGQDDYYALSAFFSQIGKKKTHGASRQSRDRRVFHRGGLAETRNPRTGEKLRPTGLGSEPLEIPANRDPRTFLADWMVSKDNPYFAHALVNRYWKHFFSRGIVDPEDDMRQTNPPSNPELLENLAQHFIDSGFDLKELVRTICRSETYQLSSEPNAYNLDDKQNFSRYYPKRLTAEVMYDAFHQVTGTSQDYRGVPSGTKAIQLANPGVNSYFLTVFGRPQADTACECERSQVANLAQSLHLLNSSEIQNKISSGSGRAAELAGDDSRPHGDRIRELYRWAYAREPDKQELDVSTLFVESRPSDVKKAYEDLIWALVNSKEFLFNH